MKKIYLSFQKIIIYFILDNFPIWEKWRIKNNIFRVSQLNEKTGKLKRKYYAFLRRQFNKEREYNHRRGKCDDRRDVSQEQEIQTITERLYFLPI